MHYLLAVICPVVCVIWKLISDPRAALVRLRPAAIPDHWKLLFLLTYMRLKNISLLPLKVCALNTFRSLEGSSSLWASSLNPHPTLLFLKSGGSGLCPSWCHCLSSNLFWGCSLCRAFLPLSPRSLDHITSEGSFFSDIYLRPLSLLPSLLSSWLRKVLRVPPPPPPRLFFLL